MKKASLILLIITISFFLIAGEVQNRTKIETSPLERPQVGFTAPHFSLNTFDGDPISLEQYVGKPVFVNFWASWCPPCRAEMPHMVEIYEEYQNEVHFLGVNMGHQDIESQALDFIEEYKVPYTNVIDRDGTVARLYQVTAFPTTIVLDKNGVVVYRKVGGMTKAEMKSAIQSALKEE